MIVNHSMFRDEDPSLLQEVSSARVFSLPFVNPRVIRGICDVPVFRPGSWPKATLQPGQARAASPNGPGSRRLFGITPGTRLWISLIVRASTRVFHTTTIHEVRLSGYPPPRLYYLVSEPGTRLQHYFEFHYHGRAH